MARLNECILYRNFEHGEILDKMAELMNAWEQNAPDLKEKEGLFFECANGLVETAGSYGFSGNLWHCYLTFLLVNNENAFSTACEIRGAVNGSINELALNDFGVFKELYDFDLTVLDEAFGISCCKVLGDYTNTGSNSKMFNSRIRDRICDLSKTLAAAESTEEFMKDMVQFYKDFGVGKLGLHKAFRVGHDENDNVEIQPITRIAHVKLEDLVGYEIPKQKLIENTEAFVRGRKANNCLLFGDAGTGKSSSIKGILNRYYDEGLRIIEVYKHQFQDLNDVIAQIKNRNYKFILYIMLCAEIDKAFKAFLKCEINICCDTFIVKHKCVKLIAVLKGANLTEEFSAAFCCHEKCVFKIKIAVFFIDITPVNL